MADWQPIETAPKDGVAIHLCRNPYDPRTGRPSCQAGAYASMATVAAWNGFAWVWLSCGVPAEQGYAFTHWRAAA